MQSFSIFWTKLELATFWLNIFPPIHRSTGISQCWHYLSLWTRPLWLYTDLVSSYKSDNNRQMRNSSILQKQAEQSKCMWADFSYFCYPPIWRATPPQLFPSKPLLTNQQRTNNSRLSGERRIRWCRSCSWFSLHETTNCGMQEIIHK